jgi:hypothetical protein
MIVTNKNLSLSEREDACESRRSKRPSAVAQQYQIINLKTNRID